MDEARRLSHHYIDTEHLLLGIMREGDSVWRLGFWIAWVLTWSASAQVARLSQNSE